MTADIFDIQRFCLHDGDGIRTTVFFKGCPLSCVWCHNPEAQQKQPQLMFFSHKCIGCRKCLSVCDVRTITDSLTIEHNKCTLCEKCVHICPVGANRVSGETKPLDEILSVVLRDKPFYRDNGGMTLSGGEPALQAKAALALIEQAKQNGINTVMETCGFGDRAFYEQANAFGVCFYYDLKALNPAKHKAFTGQDNARITDNLLFLFSLKAKIVLRMPLIPGVNDSDDDLALLREFLRTHQGKYERAEIMKYHILGKSKADALGRTYNAPDKNADEDNVKRWLSYLGEFAVVS